MKGPQFFFLLISGGPDSVYLFHHYLRKDRHPPSLSELRRAGAGQPLQTNKHSFSVIHFNHHLRGVESDAEQNFVEDLCRRYGAHCMVRHIKLTGSSGVQEKARKLRYEACFEIAQDLKRPCVFVTAHHADDVLETLVMRSQRGTGLKGLTGIRRRMTLTSKDGLTRITLLRPMLGLPKKDILKRLSKSGQAFCQDSSNKSEKYFRNRVRHALEKKGAKVGIKRRVLRDSRFFQSVDEYFEERLRLLDLQHNECVPLKTWESWSTEIRFRFFAQRMKRNGFRQQVERKHYNLAIEKQILRLGPALFVKKKTGCWFRKHDLAQSKPKR